MKGIYTSYFFKHKSKLPIRLTKKKKQTKEKKSLTTAEIMSTGITGKCNHFYANLIKKTFPCLPLPQISFLFSGKPSSYHSENTRRLLPPKSLQPIKRIEFKGKMTQSKTLLWLKWTFHWCPTCLALFYFRIEALMKWQDTFSYPC